MSQRPLVVAFHLCEQIVVDDQTRRVSPINCFTRWLIEGPPAEPQTFRAVAILASGHGSIPAALTIDPLDTGETIYRREFTVQFADPLKYYWCMLRLRRVVFPVTGVYQASLQVGGEGLASMRFLVFHKE
jgi:hypothetical protein